MAIERIESKRTQLRLTRDQMQQVTERKRAEEGAAESAFRQLYASVWLPLAENGSIGLDQVEAGGRPLQSTGVHERVMELMTTTTKKVFSTTGPRKVVELLRLGEAVEGQPPRVGIRTSDVQDAFYSFLGFTRLDTSEALRKVIARGVAEHVFGYASGSVPTMGNDGKYQVARDKIAFGQAIPEDEIDLESGFIMMPEAIPAATEPTEVEGGSGIREDERPYGDDSGGTGDTGTVGEPGTPPQQTRRDVRLSITGSRDQLFKAWPAIANLADKAGEASLQVSATSEEGFDPSWLRNAVYEPLEEADVLDEQQA